MTSLIENLRLAWEGVAANKMRALLTMLGIIIGIASVIGILTVGEGMSGSVTQNLGSLGANNINLYLQIKETPDGQLPLRMVYEPEDYIPDPMLDALSQRYPGAILGISAMNYMFDGEGRRDGSTANVSVQGVNEGFFAVEGLKLAAGRTLNQRDMDRFREVAVVSDRLVANLFGGDVQAALGQNLRVYQGTESSPGSQVLNLTIVGVYQFQVTSASNTAESKIPTTLYIPLTTAKRMNGEPDGYTSLTIATAPDVDSTAFAQTAASFLNRYYERNESFQVSSFSMQSVVESMNAIMGSISLALSVIAGISLLVGGIGVMNIMLVSVTERTREIGTRKALGATNAQIRTQFVVESMIICFIGGILGLALGTAVGYVGSKLIAKVGYLPSTTSILISVGFSLAIGLFFGYYPANKAAKMDPIEALRYE